MKRASSQCANYFKSLGIRKGDRVMLVLKRHYAFWFAILGLHKLGAIAIPATNLLKDHDFVYRFQAAGVSAILCTADGDVAEQVELAERESPTLKTKILVGGTRDGWHDFDSSYNLFSGKFARGEDAPCGSDTMLMFFTSGTTGYPKIAAHSYTYPLAHFATAKYWHSVDSDGLHFTISDTGWGKALWGKLYGQWLCEGAVFTYDFDRFHAADILPLFAKYHITTFCAPPTMYRMMIKEDISKYDLSSVKRATTAGEALNPEGFLQFEKATGLRLMEGFGQTETTLTIANLTGTTHKLGAMGKPVPPYQIELLSPDGKPVADGETGEICIRAEGGNVPCGLFQGYWGEPEKTAEVWHDGYYHTRDVAWRDEDGSFWYVGRSDDVIKSSGYRIGPFEIESVIMELPYVLECGVSAAPDEVRGQVVKASVVLTKGTEPSEALKKEIQEYVKEKTAPYKYPVLSCSGMNCRKPSAEKLSAIGCDGKGGLDSVNISRVTLFAGHYGSGKTNIAVNYAKYLAALGSPVTIADLDIVNPYFRTADSEQELAACGIRLIRPVYANTNLDLPALPRKCMMWCGTPTGLLFSMSAATTGAPLRLADILRLFLKKIVMRCCM